MDASAVGFGLPADDQAGFDEAVDQFDRAVVLDQEAVCQRTDGRVFLAGETLDCQQRLVLARRQPAIARRGVAEIEEAPDDVAELGKRAGTLRGLAWSGRASGASLAVVEVYRAKGDGYASTWLASGPY